MPDSSRIFKNIIKSTLDTREYRGLELENGLKCLLISDTKTDKSSAAVDVNIGCCHFYFIIYFIFFIELKIILKGYLVDPLPGIAHLCEHMLFLGSLKVNYFFFYFKLLIE